MHPLLHEISMDPSPDNLSQPLPLANFLVNFTPANPCNNCLHFSLCPFPLEIPCDYYPWLFYMTFASDNTLWPLPLALPCNNHTLLFLMINTLSTTFQTQPLAPSLKNFLCQLFSTIIPQNSACWLHLEILCDYCLWQFHIIIAPAGSLYFCDYCYYFWYCPW